MEHLAVNKQTTKDPSKKYVPGMSSPSLKNGGQRSAVRALLESGAQAKLTVGAVNDPYEKEADRVADQVMRMPDSSFSVGAPANTGVLQRTCASCQNEYDAAEREGRAVETRNLCPSCRVQRKHSSGNAEVSSSVESGISSLRGTGRTMSQTERSFFEPRFGTDFSNVRIHEGAHASELAQSINAKAFTLGNDVVFGAGQYQPGSSGGKHLLAHELTHVIQQGNGIRRNVIQRRPGCSSAQDTTIDDDHDRARNMLSHAISEVASYDGTNPSKVHNALSTHFGGATSNAFATWINVNLRYLWGTTWMAGYECYDSGLFESTWACGGSALATTLWCVPTVDIRLCPSYFTKGPTKRSLTLIHEWVHKYGCNFDLGYEHDPEYSGNWTITQLLNADSFENFIRDVQ